MAICYNRNIASSDSFSYTFLILITFWWKKVFIVLVFFFDSHQYLNVFLRKVSKAYVKKHVYFFSFQIQNIKTKNKKQKTKNKKQKTKKQKKLEAS